ncbi:diaminopimelate epimerase [Thioclava pacifica]|uniref:Diaminopimelate epimerase n=1 Tax=Thioclava pacifica DSM 10166 TaxID=1353537 RepID=A0A074JA09_9RHOB|nr:diaminopimelate epimerase [Thioclava pacifica]KEO54451.1 diaminopimelate epimerase [Thioclava pacifica DSM 10166]
MNTTRTASGLPFMKMHGLGNDFVVIDAREGDDPVTPALARALGDRHRGVGFDQLAVIRPAQSADFTLDFWNSDGSRAGACGNATRCVSDYMMRQLGQDHVTLVTERGALSALRRTDGLVSVNMGAPILEPSQIPILPGTDPQHLPLGGDPVAVGMGNPHCVFFVEDAEAVEVAMQGPVIEHDPLFPERTNVEFASLIGPDHLRMRVWERGTGITLACGSGTCATAVAANLRGLTGKRVLVDVDGGQLEIDWREDGVWMTGPTAHVFDATLTPEFLAAL